VLLRQLTLTPNDYQPLPEKIDDRMDSLHENHEKYRLEDTFHAVFIVIDENLPYEEFLYRVRNDMDALGRMSVLLVRTSESHDLKTGPVDFSSIGSVSEEFSGNADVRRIALGDAVDFILALHRRNTATDS
ncbi:MAG: hypothetical protein Q9198_004692, partial [Flavoplaca austrocitrina]